MSVLDAFKFAVSNWDWYVLIVTLLFFAHCFKHSKDSSLTLVTNILVSFLIALLWPFTLFCRLVNKLI